MAMQQPEDTWEVRATVRCTEDEANMLADVISDALDEFRHYYSDDAYPYTMKVHPASAQLH